IPRTQAMPMAPHAEFAVRGVPIKAVPAYNVKEERLSYHPKRNGWVGFVLTVNGVRIYHAGDTDFIPEMKDLGNIDVALLPIGGTYTMDAAEAAQAANAVAAKVTVPMHYKALLKDKAWQAEETFQAGVRGKVELLDEVK
ncbi:MAG TPA: MBL fold metallo-hydrolase, partial [archaeon]|nr:MBL fold metallo-hydrolase [archaeon]